MVCSLNQGAGLWLQKGLFQPQIQIMSGFALSTEESPFEVKMVCFGERDLRLNILY